MPRCNPQYLDEVILLCNAIVERIMDHEVSNASPHKYSERMCLKHCIFHEF